MYEKVKTHFNKTELQHLYKFDYQNNILTVKKMNIGEPIKIDHQFIMLADEQNITEREKTFFKLHHYPVEYKRLYVGSDVPYDLYLSEKLSVRFVVHLFLNQIFSLLELLVIHLFPLSTTT